MKNLWASFCIAISTLVVSPVSAQGIADLSWLAGCWSHERGESGSMEMWTAPAAGTLFGVSRTVKNNQTVAHEFMQIRTVDNELVFIAQPSNQPEGRFRAVQSSAIEVVFENLQHDFPQRVMYRRTSNDSIHARIEGMRDGKLHGIEFPMKRLNCEPA